MINCNIVVYIDLHRLGTLEFYFLDITNSVVQNVSRVYTTLNRHSRLMLIVMEREVVFLMSPQSEFPFKFNYYFDGLKSRLDDPRMIWANFLSIGLQLFY